MIRRRDLLLLVPAGLIVAAMTTTGAPAAHADDTADAAAFAGSWRNEASDAGEAHILERVNAGTEPMRAMRRNVARRRILESNPGVPRIDIRVEGELLHVSFAGVRSYAASVGGPARAGRAPDGSGVRVRFRLRGGRLHERIDAGQGYSANVYALSSGGARLSVRSTIHSRHLPAPISYSLRFRRAPN